MSAHVGQRVVRCPMLGGVSGFRINLLVFEPYLDFLESTYVKNNSKHNLQRSKRRRSFFKKNDGNLSYIFLFPALLFGFFAFVEFNDGRRVSKFGVETQAKVSAKYLKRSRHSFGEFTVSVYYLDGDAWVANVERKVSREFYDDVKVGDIITVSYADIAGARSYHQNPVEFYPGHSMYRAKGSMTWMGFCLIAFFAVYGRAYLIRQRAFLALETGKVTTAKIMQIQKHNRRHKGIYYGSMKFETDAGSIGQSLPTTLEELQALGIGARIDVYELKSRCWWVDELGQRET